MNSKELQSLRSRIEVEIMELTAAMARIKMELKTSAEICASSPADIIDCAKDESDLKDRVRLHNHSIASLGELTAALGRMTGGTFGRCQECGEPIGMPRLHARPGATLCINCQEYFERRQVAA